MIEHENKLGGIARTRQTAKSRGLVAFYRRTGQLIFASEFRERSVRSKILLSWVVSVIKVKFTATCFLQSRTFFRAPFLRCCSGFRGWTRACWCCRLCCSGSPWCCWSLALSELVALTSSTTPLSKKTNSPNLNLEVLKGVLFLDSKLRKDLRNQSLVSFMSLVTHSVRVLKNPNDTKIAPSIFSSWELRHWVHSV